MKIRQFIGSTVLVLSVVLFIAAGLLSMAARHGTGVLGDAALVVWLVTILIAAAAVWLWRIGKRMRALSAAELLASDTRRPILYLRSFLADPIADTAMQTKIAARLLPGAIPQNVASEEEQIAK